MTVIGEILFSRKLVRHPTFMFFGRHNGESGGRHTRVRYTKACHPPWSFYVARVELLIDRQPRVGRTNRGEIGGQEAGTACIYICSCSAHSMYRCAIAVVFVSIPLALPTYVDPGLLSGELIAACRKNRAP